MDPAGTAGERINDRTAQNATFPGDVNSEAATRPKARHAAARPGVRQRREEGDLAVLALQKHFGNARSDAEIAVDLHWRVQAIEVEASVAVREKLGHLRVSGFAIPHSRKQGRSPSE